MDELLIGGVSIYLWLLSILTIVWTLLPYAIFGTKKRLAKVIDETGKTNYLLEEILDEIIRLDPKFGDEQGFHDKGFRSI